jgi:hypothetical protein
MEKLSIGRDSYALRNSKSDREGIRHMSMMNKVSMGRKEGREKEYINTLPSVVLTSGLEHKLLSWAVPNIGIEH